MIFTFEGLDYGRPTGTLLDLSQVKFRGQDPFTYSNEINRVSYLLTVDGGKEYTINQDDFTWPSFSDPETENSYSTDTNCYAFARGFYFNGSYNEDMHQIYWTDFHNAKPEIVGPTNLYVYCNTEGRDLSVPFTVSVSNSMPISSVAWTIPVGADKVQINSGQGTPAAILQPTDAAHASTNLNDVTIRAVVNFVAGQNLTLTKKLTVRKPWTFGQPSIVYSNPVPAYAEDAFVSYRVLDQFCIPFPASRISGTAATESLFNKPSCYQPPGNNVVHDDGTVVDEIAVPKLCQNGIITYNQTITVDCATITNSISTYEQAPLTLVNINRIGGPTCP